MSNELADRIRDAMALAHINPHDLAKRLERNGSFITDLLRGRKKTVNADVLADMSIILGCDADYLIGLQDQPRRDGSNAESLEFGGILEMGAHRRPKQKNVMANRAPVNADPRYSPSVQSVFLKVGDPDIDCGISEGSLVLVASPTQLEYRLRPQDLVIVREVNGDIQMQGVARMEQIPGGDLAATSSADGRTFPNKSVIGIVLQVINVF